MISNFKKYKFIFLSLFFILIFISTAKSQIDFNVTGFCEKSITQFTASGISAADSVIWDFGDGNKSKVNSPQHIYINSGNYTTSLTSYTNNILKNKSRNITIHPKPVVDLGTDIDECVGTNVELDAGNFVSYLWSTGETTQKINIEAPGKYKVEVTDVNNCKSSDDVLVKFYPFTDGEVNYWYFGENAGLNFNTSPPTPLTDGQLKTYEGCATICDRNGNLLLYSDGSKVWNKNHTVMPNGSDLKGDWSATQSSIIVPKPASKNEFYLFTVAKEAESNGLNYSKINMDLNGGLGDVVNSEKNIQLQTPVAEKLTAVRHSNNIDVWVIAHLWNSDAFVAYLITSEGINTTPVISHTGFSYTEQWHWLGYLKASAKGDKLVSVVSFMQKAQVLDFDNSTGVVSNPLSFFILSLPYGAEFSPNGNFLYVGCFNKEIWQFDLTTGASAPISGQLIGSSNCRQVGSLQLAPNGQIYITKDGYQSLAAIKNPNLKGTNCAFVDEAILLGKEGNLGLPNFIQSYFDNPTISYENGCLGSITEFTINNYAALDSVKWNFGDGSPIVKGTSTTHTYTSIGTYNLETIYYQNCDIDTIKKQVVISNPPIFDLGKDTVICWGNSITLDPKITGKQYLWQDNSAEQTYITNNEGLYILKVTDGTCSYIDSIQVDISTNPSFELGDTLFTCIPDSKTLDAGGTFEKYLWNTGDTTQTITVNTDGNYWVEVIDINSCKAADSVFVSFNPKQKQNNVWCFGNKTGIEFNSNPPQAIESSAISSLEACANVCDNNGELLFSTDGISVWDKYHKLVENGDNIGGNQNPTDGVKIVQAPSNTNQYYIFTANVNNKTLQYSIIDISLNEGIGRVISKNQMLKTDVNNKLCVVPHSNKNDFWLISHSHSINEYNVFLIDNSGINTTPITHKIGKNNTVSTEVYGETKISPDFKKLVSVFHKLNIFEIYDFDNSTGLISNAVPIEGYNSPYGAEFSPDASKLYVTLRTISGTTYTGHLIQIDLKNSNSIVEVAQRQTYRGFHGLQLSPNNSKIYQINWKEKFLDVIENPNLIGVNCNFKEKAISLNNKECFLQLPSKVYTKIDSLDFSYTNSCFGDSTEFIISDPAYLSAVEWEFGEAASGGENTSTLKNPKHKYINSGDYTVKLIYDSPCGKDTVEKTIHIVNQPIVDIVNDTACANSNIIFDAGIHDGYLWNNGTTSQTLSVNTPNKYSVKVNDKGCWSKPDTAFAGFWALPRPNLGLGAGSGGYYHYLPLGDSAILYPGHFKTYDWSTGSTDSTITVKTAGTHDIRVYVTDENGCRNQDRTIVKIQDPEVNFYPIEGTYTCDAEIPLKAYNHRDAGGYIVPGFTVTMKIDSFSSTQNYMKFHRNSTQIAYFPAGSFYMTAHYLTGDYANPANHWAYEWCDNQQTGTFPYVIQDHASVKTTSQGVINNNVNECVYKEIGHVKGIAIFSGNGVTNSFNGTGKFTAAQAGEGTHKIQYYWNNEFGFEDSASRVLTVVSPLAEAGNEKSICKGDTVTLGGSPTASGGAGNYIYSWSPIDGLDNSNIANPKASPSVTTLYTLTVTDFNGNGCSKTDTIRVKVNTPPENFLGDDLYMCKDENITIDAGEYENYLWNNGETTRFLTTDTEGEFFVTVENIVGCKNTDTINIFQAPLINLELNKIDILCNGDANGKIDLNITTGSSPFEILWSNGEIVEDINNLEIGKYIVEVTDLHGCKIKDSIEISEPTVLEPTYIKENAVPSVSVLGSIDLTVSGGVEPYTFLWSNGETTEDVENLSAGTYIVTIKDANNCEKTISIIIEEVAFYCQKVISYMDNTIPAVNDSGYIDLCPNTPVTFSAYGEYPENNKFYKQRDESSYFIWDFGDGTTDTGQVVTHYFPDNRGYDVKLYLSDTLNCKAENVPKQTVRFSGSPILDINSPSEYCVGDTAIITYSQNKNSTIYYKPFSPINSRFTKIDTVFLKNSLNGVLYNSKMKLNQFAEGQTIQNNDDLLDVFANMEHSFLGELTIQLSCPNGKTVKMKEFASSQFGTAFLGEPIDIDNATLHGTGYQYTWNLEPKYNTMLSEAGKHKYTYTDRLGNIHENVDYLPSGSYTSYQNFNTLIGCPLNGEWTMEVADSLDSDNGYLFSWGLTFAPELLPENWQYTVGINNINWTGDNIISRNDTSITVLTNNSGLYNYTITFEDAFGCVYDTIVKIQFNDKPIVNLGKDTSLCNNDTVKLNVENSNSSYIWSNGNTSSNIEVFNSGKYWVEVTNNKNCKNSDTININFTPLPSESVNLGNDTTLCDNETITYNFDNSFDYLWQDGSVNPFYTINSAGKYWLKVSNKCEVFNDTVTVSLLNKPSINLGKDTSICSDSHLDLTAPDNLNYLWFSGATSQTVTISETGNYWLEASNKCGSDSDTINLKVFEIPFLKDIQTQSPMCYNDKDGYINIKLNNQNEENLFKYSIDNGLSFSNDSVFNNLSSGIYDIVVKNKLDCKTSNQIELSNPKKIEILEQHSDLKCYNDKSGSISLDVVGGFSPYTFKWNNGISDKDLYNLSVGKYTVFVFDKNNCSDTLNIDIEQPKKLTIKKIIENTSCQEANNGSIQLEINGGVSPYNIEWNTGENQEYLENLASNWYKVTVSDLNLCITTDSSFIDFNQESCLFIPNTITPNNDGSNDTWKILGIEYYPEVEIEIFDRWGRLIYKSKGYTENWNGTFNGEILNADSYYYIIRLNSNKKIIKGVITIIR